MPVTRPTAGATRGPSRPWPPASLLLALFVLIERRVEHPLLPFRILLNRTRATAFTTMMIVPAAMFAMFFFLSLYVQNIMGYSPIETGLAFLPFCFGMVFAATLSSKLMSLVDPRFIAGVGTILAGFSLFMFSRLVDRRLPRQPDQRGGPRDVVPRRLGELLDRPVPVHRHDVDGHGPDLRADDPRGRARRGPARQRHRLRRAEHRPAGTKRAGRR